MNIHENTALLDAFLDGETTPEETAEVRAHLADCPDCRAYVADAMTLRAAFPTEEDAELPADFAKNVMAAVAKTPQPRPKKQPWGKVAAAAACVAVLLVVQNHFAGGGVSGSSMSSGNEAAVADTAAYSAAAPAAGAAEDDSVSYEESAMVTAEPNAKNATEKGSAAAEHMDAWVENGNVVFAGTAQITQAQADELLAEYDGKPYFDADRPEAGVIGTGYAMEQADFEKILEALDIPWEAEANPQRTTELYCIVVTADED